MLEMLMQWYRRRFSDPEAIALLVILVAGFGIIFFFSGLLAPLLVKSQNLSRSDIRETW